MRRRLIAGLVFMSAVGLAAAGRAQPSAVPRIGVLDWLAPSTSSVEPFRSGMRDLGYVEGRNILIDYRFAEGQAERAEAFAMEMVRNDVRVIVAFASPAAQAARKVTSTIPIVVSSADPIAAGLVTSLARPGGNVTGISNMMPDIGSKQMELLRELLPNLRRVAFLGSKLDPATPGFLREAGEAASRGGVKLDAVLIGTPAEIDEAFAAMSRDRVDAVIVQPLFALSPGAAASVAAIAARHGLPTITNFDHFPRAGGLISYGPPAAFSRHAAARYVDRILKGANPADLPFEQPTTFELVINLGTARKLGITIQPALIARANEVIE